MHKKTTPAPDREEASSRVQRLEPVTQTMQKLMQNSTQVTMGPTIPLLGTDLKELKKKQGLKVVAHRCPQRHHAQQPEGGNKPNVHQLMKDEQNVFHPHKRTLISHKKE